MGPSILAAYSSINKRHCTKKEENPRMRTPQIRMYTLFDSYDFSGKDLVVFITHYGSRFGRCVQTIRALEPEATVYEGLAINQTQVAGAQNDVIARLQELGY